MKKITSLLLALVMVFSMSTVAFAISSTCEICGGSPDIGDCNGQTVCFDCYADLTASDGEYETLVSYTGDGVSVYEVTVPATLAPGEQGKVKVSGTWATDMTVIVTAPETVTLTNDIDGSTKVLDVEFDGISQAGDNTNSILVNATISVEEITNALFGTWEGTIVYTVSTSEPEINLITFTIDGTEYQAEESMTWTEWNESNYNTGIQMYYDNYSFPAGWQVFADDWCPVLCDSNKNIVGETDTIIAGENYQLIDTMEF